MNFKVRFQQAGDTVWEKILLSPKVWTAMMAVVIALGKQFGWHIETEVFIAVESAMLILIAAIKE